MREPGPNCDLVIAYQGSVAPEAIRTAGILGERCRDIGVLAVTSADRLNAGWSAAQVARASGQRDAQSHADRLLGSLPAHCQIVTVIDGHPATLAWIGGIARHRILPLVSSISARLVRLATSTAPAVLTQTALWHA